MKKLCACTNFLGNRCNEPGVVPVDMLMEHCKGATKLLEDLSEQDFICEQDCGEIMLDSQWDVGWKDRVNFLSDEITSQYYDPVPGREGKMRRKAALIIYNAGITALSGMCPICNHCNEGSKYAGVRLRDLPEALRKINEKYFKRYPAEFLKDFGNVVCPKCAKVK